MVATTVPVSKSGDCLRPVNFDERTHRVGAGEGHRVDPAIEQLPIEIQVRIAFHRGRAIRGNFGDLGSRRPQRLAERFLRRFGDR